MGKFPLHRLKRNSSTYMHQMNKHCIQVGKTGSRLHIEAQLLFKVPTEADLCKGISSLSLMPKWGGGGGGEGEGRGGE